MYESLLQAEMIKMHELAATTQETEEITTAKVTTPNYLETCTESEKIVFLKTHKTGSETMAGIFRKYAIMNNVSTILSTRTGGHLYGSGRRGELYQYSPLTPDLVPIIGIDYPGAHYELLANHMTYNKDFIDKWFDSKVTKKITILRNPVSQLVSSWKYYYKIFRHPAWPRKRTSQEQAQAGFYVIIYHCRLMGTKNC